MCNSTTMIIDDVSVKIKFVLFCLCVIYLYKRRNSTHRMGIFHDGREMIYLAMPRKSSLALHF